ncbi:MAG: hypothetical protein HFI36_05995 [Bacilli bacterium]|jgi:hypothetical protein|nr:hypothetical protein [Bacilli bacterium]MCX4254850.1 hypothetical protein [Bacilli bacterium]
MDNVILTDIEGNKYKAEILFTHFDYFFSKNYIVYLFDKDLLAASYETVNNNLIINSNLSSKEYDMIDKEIERKLGELYA